MDYYPVFIISFDFFPSFQHVERLYCPGGAGCVNYVSRSCHRENNSKQYVIIRRHPWKSEFTKELRYSALAATSRINQKVRRSIFNINRVSHARRNQSHTKILHECNRRSGGYPEKNNNALNNFRMVSRCSCYLLNNTKTTHYHICNFRVRWRCDRRRAVV